MSELRKLPSKTANELMNLQEDEACVEQIGKAFKPDDRVTMFDIVKKLPNHYEAWEIICRGLLPNKFMGYTSGDLFCMRFRRDMVVGPRFFNMLLNEIDKWRKEEA